MPSTDWSAWITTFSTVMLTILTFIYVRVTGKILAAQSDPCVILTVIHDADRPTILQLVAKNVGTGLAHDVKFEFSRPLPHKAWGLSQDSAEGSKVMRSGPLVDGIPALGPGETRRIDWGQYGGLEAALGNEHIVATCRFRKNGKEMPPTRCILEVASFAGTCANESPARKVAQKLEDISKTLEHLASGYHRLKIEVASLPAEPRNQPCGCRKHYAKTKRAFRYVARNQSRKC